MNRLSIHILFTFVAMLTLLPACEGLDDNYSSNPNHRLNFSVDTLSFDTIFSSVGSTTKQFMIYNPNNEALNIESILLAGGGSTGFRMNVDGRKGTRFEQVGILAKDSMYVFVEVTVDPNDSNQPLLIQDSVVFFLNGRKQSVLLEAYGQDVHLYKNGHTITTNTQLPADRPYLIYDSLVIAKDITVSIEKGATFYFHNKANLVVHGTLKAAGSKEEPITFRGDRLDFIIDNLLPYDRTPAQWGGIFFKSDSYENELNHVMVRNATTGLTFLPADPERMKLKLNNAQITNMDGNLFSAINCKMEVANSEFTNATGMIVALMSGNYQFTHCTLVNVMSLETRNDSLPYTLLLTNALPNKQTGKLSAVFDNCVIDGSRSAKTSNEAGGELLFDKLSDDVYYRFNHCVLKMKGEESANFTGNAFINKSLSYRMLGGRNNKYAYDFRLDSVTTVGVGMADPAITQHYPIDRYGVNRLTSANGPTSGAYEFVPKEE